MLRNGTYPGRAIGAALGFTKGEKPQVAVELEVTEGEDAGQRITWFGYFSEKTEGRTLESLRTLGWQGDDLDDLSTATGDCMFVVEQEEWEGKVSAKVKWINKAGGLALSAPMDANQARSFAERMKGKAIASRMAAQGSGTAPAPAKPRPASAQRQAPPKRDQHPNAPGADDDIPF